jgi:hypothetical protein
MRVILIIVLGFLLWGCEGGSILGPESMRIKLPKVGTTFYYESFEINRYENRVSGTKKEFSRTVIASDTILFGKSDVFVLRYQSADSSYLEFYAIDTDQNLMQRTTLGSMTQWITIPMTTLAETTDTLQTLVDIAPGKRGTLEYVYMHSYYGDQSFKLDTLQLNGRKFRSTVKFQLSASGKQEYAGESQSIQHYLPSLSILAESKTLATYDALNDKWNNGYVTLLKTMVNE